MKKNKLKGYLKDLENKNKNYSYDKVIKILDISNYVYLDCIKDISYNDIATYKNAKILFEQIVEEFETIYDFLSDDKVLMGACLLRNVYENIMYIMAVSLNINLDINVKTTASYFKNIVNENIESLLDDFFDSEKINELYAYLSKITHVTNIKEIVVFLISKKSIKKYIVNELKYVTVLIEYLYLNFLYKKCNLKNDFISNMIVISSNLEIINTFYFCANSAEHDDVLNIYFYGEKNQKYLKEQQEKLIAEIKNFQVEMDDKKVSMKKIIEEIIKQFNEKNYEEKVNKILNDKTM